jgi:hypothetical protein
MRRKEQMTAQTIFQIVLAVGVVLSAIGTLGSYYFGKVEDAATRFTLESGHRLEFMSTRPSAPARALSDTRPCGAQTIEARHKSP